MAKLKLCTSILSGLATIAKSAGNMILVKDAEELYFDISPTERIKITDIKVLDNDSDRLALLSPLPKFYYIKSDNLLWNYSNGNWSQININPGNLLKLGTTSTTAYRGDRGEVAYLHSQAAHARTDATRVTSSKSNGNITIDGIDTKVYQHPSGTNPHGTTKNDIGLGNVNNTSDLNKPISIATKSALDGLNSKLSTITEDIDVLKNGFDMDGGSATSTNYDEDFDGGGA